MTPEEADNDTKKKLEEIKKIAGEIKTGSGEIDKKAEKIANIATSNKGKYDYSGLLASDYQNCYGQMQKYQDRIYDLLKHAFTIYGVIFGLIATLDTIFKWAPAPQSPEKVYTFINLAPITVPSTGESSTSFLPLDKAAAVSFLFFIAFIFGLFYLWLLIRNRVYFCQMARYVNEMRKNAFDATDFENKSGMVCDPGYPKYYDWLSAQIGVITFISAVNGIFGAILFRMMVEILDVKINLSDWQGIAVSLMVAVIVAVFLVLVSAGILWKAERKDIYRRAHRFAELGEKEKMFELLKSSQEGFFGQLPLIDRFSITKQFFDKLVEQADQVKDDPKERKRYLKIVEYVEEEISELGLKDTDAEKIKGKIADKKKDMR